MASVAPNDDEFEGTGYDLTDDMETDVVHRAVSQKSNVERHAAWLFIKQCPSCSSNDLWKYYNASDDKYAIDCYAPPKIPRANGNSKDGKKSELCGWNVTM